MVTHTHTHSHALLICKPSLPHLGQGTLPKPLFRPTPAFPNTASGFLTLCVSTYWTAASWACFPLAVCFLVVVVSQPSSFLPTAPPLGCLSGPPDHVIGFLPREALWDLKKKNSGPWEYGPALDNNLLFPKPWVSFIFLFPFSATCPRPPFPWFSSRLQLAGPRSSFALLLPSDPRSHPGVWGR